MTTDEYMTARKSKSWKFNRIVLDNSFMNVNRIHPIKQVLVKNIVEAAKNDKAVKSIIIFGSSIRYDCDITSDLDICIEWENDCYDADGILKPFTKNLRSVISTFSHGHADVVNKNHLDDTVVKKAVEEGVIVYEHNV